jgi:hypothetical protein
MNFKVQKNRRRLIKAAAALFAITTLAASATDRNSNSEPFVVANHGHDEHATRAKDDGPPTATPQGLPPAESQAKPRKDKSDDPIVRGKADAGVDEGEDETREASNGYSSKPLIYQQGAVQTAPRIYLVLLGSSWLTSSGDPYGVASRLHYFYSALGGSGINNTMKQYGGTVGSFTNPAGQYKGWIKDSTPISSRPTSQDIRDAAIRAARRLNDIGFNAQYVVATPWGVVDQYSLSGTHACAWHYHTTVPGYSSEITYTSLPYTPYLDKQLAFGCGTGRVNGANGILDGVTINAVHEYAESVNDPLLNGWKDSDRQENADKCSWVNLANMRMANGSIFPVQPTWNNTYKRLYNFGCYYSS